MTNDYEILPHQLLEDLKFDVEALKKKLTEPEAKANELILEIETLKDAVHELNNVFNKALEHSKEEDAFKAIQRLNERIDTVVTQNETIAKGMIAISDKLEDFMHKNKSSVASHSTGSSLTGGLVSHPAPPTMPGGPRLKGSGLPQAPMGAAPAMGQHFVTHGSVPGGLPPPPSPGKRKKRSLF